MLGTITMEDRLTLQMATALQQQIEGLYGQVDTLLDSLSSRLISYGSLEQLQAAIPLFPRGFHRSQLQAKVNQLLRAQMVT